MIDFIYMATSANKKRLFNFFEKTLKEKDKFQSVVLKVSEFGLVQMTRKRSGKTLVQQLTVDCSCCKGSGFVKSLQTESYAVLRKLKEFLQTESPKQACATVNPEIFINVTSVEYNSILELEKEFKCKIELQDSKNFSISQYKFEKH